MKVRKIPGEKPVSKEFVRVLDELAFAANQRQMMSTDGGVYTIPMFKTTYFLKRWWGWVRKLCS